MGSLIIGAAVILLATLLGGVTGFGYGLVAAPLLLLAGLPLPVVVVVNLAIALFTRLLVLLRFRKYLEFNRAGQLVIGSIPGIGVGLFVADVIDTGILKAAAGCLALAAATVLALPSWPTAERRRAHVPASALAAGLGGGFLGVTVSLNGIVPAVLLTHDRTRPLPFIANLAAYFVVSNSVALTSLFLASDSVTVSSLGRYLLFWLPVGLVGNVLGTYLAPRLPYATFRGLTLIVIAAAGASTVASTL